MSCCWPPMACCAMSRTTEIRDILLQVPSLKAACTTLIDAANEGGGDDNSTCVLVRVRNGASAKADPETPPPA